MHKIILLRVKERSCSNIDWKSSNNFDDFHSMLLSSHVKDFDKPLFVFSTKQFQAKQFFRLGRSKTIPRETDFCQHEPVLRRQDSQEILSWHQAQLLTFLPLFRRLNCRKRNILSNFREEMFARMSKFRQKLFLLQLSVFEVLCDFASTRCEWRKIWLDASTVTSPNWTEICRGPHKPGNFNQIQVYSVRQEHSVWCWPIICSALSSVPCPPPLPTTFFFIQYFRLFFTNPPLVAGS